ncbi:MAG TPA: hypothetical protein VGB99_15960 [Acidobacteriota bacterium]
MRRTACLAFGALLLAASIATAQEDFRVIPAPSKSILLRATILGQQIDARGQAMRGELGPLQTLVVSVSAKVPDGTTFLVSVFDGTSDYLVGSLSMFLGVGQLRVAYGSSPGAGQPLLPPANQIRQVFVADLWGIQLEGMFPPPDTPPE